MQNSIYNPHVITIEIPRTDVLSTYRRVIDNWCNAIHIAADQEKCDDIIEATQCLRRVLVGKQNFIDGNQI